MKRAYIAIALPLATAAIFVVAYSGSPAPVTAEAPSTNVSEADKSLDDLAASAAAQIAQADALLAAPATTPAVEDAAFSAAIGHIEDDLAALDRKLGPLRDSLDGLTAAEHRIAEARSTATRRKAGDDSPLSDDELGVAQLETELALQRQSIILTLSAVNAKN